MTSFVGLLERIGTAGARRDSPGGNKVRGELAEPFDIVFCLSAAHTMKRSCSSLSIVRIFWRSSVSGVSGLEGTPAGKGRPSLTTSLGLVFMRNRGGEAMAG
jgi:hypothetical protein